MPVEPAETRPPVPSLVPNPQPGRSIIMRVNHREPELENHDRGLDWDLPRLLQRRGLLRLVAGAGLAGAGLVTLGACADNGANTDTAATPGSDGAPSGAPSGGPRGG